MRKKKFTRVDFSSNIHQVSKLVHVDNISCVVRYVGDSDEHRVNFGQWFKSPLSPYRARGLTQLLNKYKPLVRVLWEDSPEGTPVGIPAKHYVNDYIVVTNPHENSVFHFEKENGGKCLTDFEWDVFMALYTHGDLTARREVLTLFNSRRTK